MSEYRKIEKTIASLAARHPALKTRLKLAYQKVNHVFYKKPYKLRLADGVLLKEVFPNESFADFWGYYDSCPALNGKYLSHRFKHTEVKNEKASASEIEIWLNDAKISTTNAWNWQQGARIFWVDENTILFNVVNLGAYQAKLLNLKKGTEEFISSAIYAFHRDSKSALGLDFNRLASVDPSYGYFSEGVNNSNELKDEEDGIFSLDISKNKKTLLVSIDSLKKLKPNPTMVEARHGINHIQIAPSGKRFMFLHRWYMKNGRKFERLITADMDGSNLYILSDDGMVSHCNWQNDSNIIGWMYKQNFGNGYYVLKDQSDRFEQIGRDILTQDGHPSFSPCSKYLLTDTYPDRFRMSHLLLFELSSKKLTEVGSFYTPLKYHDEIRCDLHPRFIDSENITIDTVYQGARKQVELNISSLL